jgi:tripartite ATP-independent transporter DctP family solute receptor
MGQVRVKYRTTTQETKMRFGLRGFKIATLSALIVAPFASPLSTLAADYPAMTIKFGDVVNRNFGYYKGMEAFKEEIEKSSGGKIKVELLTDGKLGSPKDTLEAVQLGAVQMAMNTASYTQNVVAEHGVWNLPYLIRDRKTWREFAYGPLGKELGDKIESRGLKFLTWCSAGGRGIISKKPLATPADFAGQKIRSLPDPVTVDTLKAFKGQPVVMHLGELYTGLQQGVLDGADVSVELVNAFKFHEPAKFYTETQHIFTPGMVVTNLDWWKKQNKDTQALIEQVITTTFRKANDGWYLELDPSLPLEKQRELAKSLVDKGVTIVKPDLVALKAATAPVVDQYKAKIGKDYVEKIMKAVGY